MTLITENGWPQIPADVLDKSPVPGLQVNIETAPGDVAIILRAWMLWFDRNVEDIEFNHQRDEWGWSRTNSVWDSNHLSGTAVDINATKYPMGYYKMEQWKVDKVREGQRLFLGNIFWGRDWNTPDEMHFQIQGNAAQIKPLADKLRAGYLGLMAPADPDAYPLPVGYYFGPLDGPNESISGLYETDSQYAKDSLGRWQDMAGIPVTKHWDAATQTAVQQLQEAKGWFHDDNAFKGRLYVGEWDAVIKEGWRAIPVMPHLPGVPGGVYWADVSRYQQIPIDRTYPHRVFCFRVNTGNEVDALADDNYRIACEMADEGKLDAIIAYSFFRPHSAGHATWATFKTFIQDRGVHPKLVAMVDVESAKGSPLGEVVGDQSYEANGFVSLAANELFGGDRRRVLGYHNIKADPGMWLDLPPDLKMIRPNYSIQPGKGKPDGPQLWAHQFTQEGRCEPWGGRNVDLNFYAGDLPGLLDSLGLAGVAAKPEAPLPAPDPAPETGGRHRKIELAPGETLEVVVRA